uniref:Uncharacterized protein n=1 Tax=Arundo donax TaxID=35708 RepID=A0A0A9DQT0_ARUDO
MVSRTGRVAALDSAMRFSAALPTSRRFDSTKNTLAPECFSRTDTMAASCRVLKVQRTAPAMGTAKCSSYIAGTFGLRTATTSPRATPKRVVSTAATRTHLSRVSFHVRRRSPYTTAARAPYTAAARSMKLIGDSGA